MSKNIVLVGGRDSGKDFRSRKVVEELQNKGHNIKVVKPDDLKEDLRGVPMNWCEWYYNIFGEFPE